MKIGLVQYSPEWENKEKNKQKLFSLINQLDEECTLLVFPELTITGFTMKSIEYAEDLDGISVCFYKELAAAKGAHVMAGVIEQDGKNYFNTLVHVNDRGELQSSYRKVHPFSYSTEDQHYSRGLNTVIAKINDWRIGLSICYDLRFPELYRYYGKEKVHLIINIANWPDTRIEHWRTLLKARAIENQCYVAGVNRVGRDPKHYYNGYSSVFDPMGNEIITCKDEEKIITTDLTRLNVEEVQTKLPFLNDIFLIK